MKAILIAMVQVNDPETYKKYTAKTPEIIHKYGGRFLVRGGQVDTIEGNPFGQRLVILEFPSRQAIHNFYHSAEYQAILTYRQQSSTATFIVADAVPEGLIAPNDQVEKSR